MKLVEMKCPNCGANLQVDISKGKAFCQYCGTALHIEDENKNTTINDPENLGYQFEKGRQRAEKERNKNNHLLIIASAIASVVAIIIFFSFTNFKKSASNSNASANSSTSNTGTIASGSHDENVVINDTPGKYSDADFEVNMEELRGDRYTYYLFTIKNNSDLQILSEITGTGMDASNNPIDVATAQRQIMEPGETGLTVVMFFRNDIDHIDYKINYSEPVVSHSVQSKVDKKITVNADSIISTITNNSPKPLNVKHVDVIFRDSSGKIVDYEGTYYTGDDLPVGQSASAKIECPNNDCKAFVNDGSIDYYYTLLNPIN